MSARMCFIKRCHHLLHQKVITLLDVMAIEEQCLELDEAEMLDEVCQRYRFLVLQRFRRLSPFAETSIEYRRRLAFISHTSISDAAKPTPSNIVNYPSVLKPQVPAKVRKSAAAYWLFRRVVGYKV